MLGSKQPWEILVFVIFKLYFRIICSCSNYLKYMKNFEYWRILVDSGALCSGVGEDFLPRRPFFFYENGRNSETKSRKINPKVENEPSLWGLLTKFRVVWQKMHFWVKNQVIVHKERRSLLAGRHVLATNGPSCAHKKVPFFQIIISHLTNFWRFLGKTDFS